MTSQEFITHLNVLTAEDTTLDYLRECFSNMHKMHNKLEAAGHSMAGASSSQQQIDAVDALRKLLGACSNEIRALSSRTIWSGTENLEQRIEVWMESELTKEIAEFIDIQIGKFSDLYEAFTKSYHPEATFVLIEAGNDLYHSLTSLRQTAELSQRGLSDTCSENSSEKELNIHLGSTQNAAQFAEKLTAIILIYEELCALLSVSATTHPLRIGKIESGSLWAKLFGESKVIALFVDLTKASVHYLHRNYTKEGKISAMPRSVEAVEAVLGLKRSLEAQGMDVSEMKPRIEKASAHIAQHLDSLLRNEPIVVVNTVRISVATDLMDYVAFVDQNMLEDTVVETLELPDQPPDNEK